jgi:translation initiation factor IF-2
VAGSVYGKIRTLLDYKGAPLNKAGPATPAVTTGFKDLPEFGDRFTVFKNEKAARQAAMQYKTAIAKNLATANVTGADLLGMMNKQKETQEVNVIVKADVQGSLISVIDSLKLLENNELSARIVLSGIGNITENDVRQAHASSAIIYGFNVQLPLGAKRLAARDKVEVRVFKVIYELLDDAHHTLEELLAPEVVETEIGALEIKAVFKSAKNEVICGGQVTTGKVASNSFARVLRGEEKLAEVEVTRVQRLQQEAKEVFEGEMCGLTLKTEEKLLLQEKDKLELFTRELRKRTL